MNKSKLQEFCHQKSWGLPKYTTIKQGPDHDPRFTSTVFVNEILFQTSGFVCRSSKEAQDQAAKLVFDHFTAPKTILQSPLYAAAAADPEPSSGNLCKNRLQNYAPLPMYSREIEENHFVFTQDEGLYKSLLQELALKMDFGLPVYKTSKSGPHHIPVFLSSVEVGNGSFQGDEARTKKQAEISAAKVAYTDLTGVSGLATAKDATFSSGSHSAGAPLVKCSSLQTTATKELQQQPLPNVSHKMELNAKSTDILPVQEELAEKSEGNLCKNRLQNYAPLPMYSRENDGAPHARRVKARDTFNGNTHEAPDCFSTLKDAEHAAAKFAFEALPPDDVQEDEGLYKSRFQGHEARTKKQAEISAAKVAYTDLTRGLNIAKRQISPSSDGHLWSPSKSCKYGSNCRFNHPDPTAAPVYPTSERGLPTPPAFAINNSASETSVYSHHQQQMLVGEFPERPGQPECSYFLKTGDCKYRSSCKFHHPKSRTTKTSQSTLSDKGLPLRPDQNICSHYSRYGICKYGPSCKYDHPVNYPNPAFAGGSGPDGPRGAGGSGMARESLIQQPV